MSQLARQFLKLFGDSGASTNFAKFGSQAAGTPVKTKNLQTIQALSAWLNGLQDAVNPSNHAPFMEDINALFYSIFYQLCYNLQAGIPEWDDTTTYYVGSLVVKPGTNEIYTSNSNANLNNALPNQVETANWTPIFPYLTKYLRGFIDKTQLDTNVAGIGLAGGAGNPLSVNVDNITLEIPTDTLVVKAITDSLIVSVAASKITGVLGRTHVQQQSFEAIVPTASNVTGNGDLWLAQGFGSIYSVGISGFNTGTGIFTVPTEGVWLFSGASSLQGVYPNASKWFICLVKNGSVVPYKVRTHMGNLATPLLAGTDELDFYFPLYCLAGDTVQLGVEADGTTKSISAVNTLFGASLL